MKKEKGITLLALIIYIIVFTLVLSLLASLSNYIYSNLHLISSDKISPEEFNKFNSYFVQDVKKSENANVTNKGTGPDDEQVIIQLSDGAYYTWIKKDSCIYKDKAKIAQKITTFSAKIVNGNSSKKIIEVTIATKNSNDENQFNKKIDYVLKYW